MTAITSWPGSQSLLSMWFHEELVPAVETYGLAGVFARVDGLRTEVGGDLKAGHLARHLAALGVRGEQVVLIGDSLDDADGGRLGGRRIGALHRRVHRPGPAAGGGPSGGRHPGRSGSASTNGVTRANWPDGR